MNRFIKILSVLFLTGIILSSCEEHSDNITYEKKSVQFATDVKNVELLKLPVENATVSITVELVSEPLDEDITVTLKPQGGENVTALEGEHYEILNNTVTIPAGEVEATVDYAEVIHDHFMVEEAVMARVVISEESDLPHNENLGPAVLDINMKKRNVCPLEHEELEGIYKVEEISNYDGALAPYEIKMEHMTGDSMVVTGLWETSDEVIVEIGLTPGEETVKIPSQDYFMSDQYGQATIVGTGSSINTCEKIITTSYEIFVDAGYFDIITESVWTYMGPASEEKSFPYERKGKKTLKE